MECIIKKPDAIRDLFDRKPGDDQTNTHYCPGCGHGIVHKLIAESMDKLGMKEKTIFISPVGCSVFAYYYFNCGNSQVAHGRAPAVATGLTRSNPDNYLISYQGDGDLAAIGTAEIIHAANRGEKMTVFFVNNSIYGMTGGQMAPTSLIGQKTATTPYGRSVENEGFPIRIAEMVSLLEAPAYVARCSVHDIRHIMKAKKIIHKALENQVNNKGFSLVEILSPCPSGWKIKPDKNAEWVEKYVLPYFEIAVFKDVTGERTPPEPVLPVKDPSRVKELLDLHGDSSDQTVPVKSFASLRTLSAGFGGQGVLVLGHMLALCGMKQGYHVSWLPSYGPEMRGGTANCSVVMDQKTIGSPDVSRPQLLVAMNMPSYEKFLDEVQPGGTVIYNSSMIAEPRIREDVTTIALPATEIAQELGDERTANVVILGAITAVVEGFSDEAVAMVLDEKFRRAEVRELNGRALQRGKEAVKER